MILDLIFKRSETQSLENPNTPLTGQNLQEFIYGNDNLPSSVEAALRLSAVYACMYVLASSIAQLPLVVFKKQGERRLVGTDHAAYYLLHDEPNVWQTSYKWRESLMFNTLGWGNGYSRIHSNSKGELQQIEYLKASETELVKLGNRWFYSSLSDSVDPIAVALEDMIHVRSLGSDGKKGVSLIRQHAKTIGLGLAAQQYGTDFFNGGGKPTALVTVKGGNLKKDAWDNLKAVYKKATASLKSSENRTLLLPADLDYKALTIAPEDAQFIETRKFNRSEIASIFNVPSHMINDLDKATFSNISEQSIQFVRHSIMPWVVNIEQELNRKLFTIQERKAGYYVKHNIGALLRGTPKERAEFYHYAITDGWMHRNEVRALEDLDPVEGLNEMLISVNAVTVNQFNQQQQSEQQKLE